MSSEWGGTVVAAFRTEEDAESALEALRSRGLASENISVAARNSDSRSRVGLDLGSNVLAAAVLGALFVGILGATLAWIMALPYMAQPGTGPWSGVGSPAAAFTGALLGAIIGGLLGGLAGLMIPTSKDAVESDEGGFLVQVRTPAASEVGYVEELLVSNGGQEVRTEIVERTPQAEPVPLVEPALPGPTTDRVPAVLFEDFSGLQALVRDEEEPELGGTWMSEGEPREEIYTQADSDDVTTEEDVERDVEASTGETGWYESLPDPPATAQADTVTETYSGLTADEETWADIANLGQQEDNDLNENPEGTNPNTATGTQGAINPDTGTFGTAGTPVTTGEGVSGSTIGTGTSGGELATQSGDFRGSTPDTAAYEMGGRASTDSQSSLQGDERDATVEDKYVRTGTDSAPIQQDPGTVDVYEAGPSYGEGTRQEVDRTDLYSNSDVDTAPTYAVTPTDEANASAGTDMPGTADPRGLGDNTDDVS